MIVFGGINQADIHICKKSSTNSNSFSYILTNMLLGKGLETEVNNYSGEEYCNTKTNWSISIDIIKHIKWINILFYSLYNIQIIIFKIFKFKIYLMFIIY